MADDQWLLKEDGYLRIDADIKNIVYHPILNVLLVFTKTNEVKVLDVNSGVILQSCCLSGMCFYLVCLCITINNYIYYKMNINIIPRILKFSCVSCNYCTYCFFFTLM